MAGYSGTPLPKKLGLKPGQRIWFVGAPASFEASLGPMADVERAGPTSKRPLDLIVLFCPDRATLEKRFAAVAARLAPAGMLWVGWPKKASGVPTDLDENVVREHGLTCGLVDVKVCAIDDVWSGLKFVIRLAQRGKPK